MKHTFLRHILRPAGLLLLIAAALTPAAAQNSLPRPGAGGFGGPGPAMPPGAPAPAPRPPFGGGPWGNPWGMGGIGPNSPYWTSMNPTPVFQQNGQETVMAIGTGASGLPQRIPITVQYTSNGASYDVTVLNAWNTFTDSWNYNVDQQAYRTAYMMGGQMYNYYVPLSTGIYYFNL